MAASTLKCASFFFKPVRTLNFAETKSISHFVYKLPLFSAKSFQQLWRKRVLNKQPTI